MPDGYLAGTRVIDMSQYIPGPYASLMLADLGADVVKVEPPAGDPMRRYGAAAEDQVSPFYVVMNGGKRVTRADLKSDRDRQAVVELVRAADVLIESYRPGVLARLGLGRNVLAAANPRLIHCAITGYGQNGPYAAKAGHDINYMALGGGLALSGTVERPAMTAPPVSDYAGAQQAVATILAALLACGRTGRGSYIDLSMVDTVLAWQACSLSAARRGGPEAQRAGGADSGGFACYNIYRAADGRFLTIGADEDKFWQNFCAAVGRPDWVGRKNEPAPQRTLIAEVQALIGGRDSTDWEALLGNVDCCYQRVLEPDEVLRDPQLAARQVIQEGPGGAVEVLYPAWLDGRPPRRRSGYVEVDLAAALRSWGQRADGAEGATASR